MSATADSTATGTNAPVADSSRLEQPGDAVAMESMPQSTTSAASQSAAAESDSAAADATREQQPSTDNNEPAAATAAEAEKANAMDAAVDGAGADADASPKPKEESTAAEQAGDDGDDAAAAPAPPSKERQRSDSVMAIGPATDEIKAITPGTHDGRSCNITLLLTSGARHPYRFDAKYLTRRNVTMPEETEDGHPDPFSISVYTFKELILREWRNDWEAKPASPSSIRLIHFGKLLDDKEPLRKYNFSPESPNVVHMSIRPQDLDEEEPKAGNKSQASGGGDGQRSRGGCCVVL